MNFTLREQFLVEWLPNARTVLMAKLIKKGQPRPTGRHGNVLVKFLANSVVMDIDRKLRPWATLAGEQRLSEEHVLKDVRDFDVVFKVASQIIQVVELRPPGVWDARSDTTMSAFAKAMFDQLRQPGVNVRFHMEVVGSPPEWNFLAMISVHLNNKEQTLIHECLGDRGKPRVLDIGCGIGRHRALARLLAPVR